MELNYKKLGDDGPVIIILHGLFGMLDNWKTIARKLSEDFQVYIVDQRDHGRSGHTSAFSYRLLASDLMGFLEMHKLEPALIIGHSMGGKATMQFLNDYPGNTEMAMIVDIGPLENSRGHDQVFEALFAVRPGQISSRSEAEEIMANHLSDTSVVQFLMKNLSRNKEGGYRWKMNLTLLHEQYEEILAAINFDYPISTKTIFVRGGRSNYVNTENSDAISDVFVDSEIYEVEDAGHWVHADDPSRLMEIIKSLFG